MPRDENHLAGGPGQVADGHYEEIVEVARALRLGREDVVGVCEALTLALRPIFDDETGDDAGVRAARLTDALEDNLGALHMVIHGLEMSIKDLARVTGRLDEDLLEDVGHILWY